MVNEAEWEEQMLEALSFHGWTPTSGRAVAPGAEDGRESWDDIVLPRPARWPRCAALNPPVPGEYLDQALRRGAAAPKSQDAIAENYRLHQILVDGYRGISYIDADGIEQNPTTPPARPRRRRQRLARRQPGHRPARATRAPLRHRALRQRPAARDRRAEAGRRRAAPTSPPRTRSCRRTCASSRWRSGSACSRSSSDGIDAQYGTPFTPLNHFAPWNVDDDGQPLASSATSRTARPSSRLDDAARRRSSTRSASCSSCATSPHSTRAPTGLAKRIAKPHQYFAVTKAVGSDRRRRSRPTARPASSGTPRARASRWRWSSTPTSCARQPKLQEPDDRRHHRPQRARRAAVRDVRPQRCCSPRSPCRCAKRAAAARRAAQPRHRRHLLHDAAEVRPHRRRRSDAGAEHPLLTDRRNIIVIVDEAHRSHYDDLDGYARHLRDALPNATLIAFTGTPISFAERNTREVFGDYIDIYDLTRAVDDGATVPVYFEPRLIKVGLADGRHRGGHRPRRRRGHRSGSTTSSARGSRQSVAVINAVYGAPERHRDAGRRTSSRTGRSGATRMMPFIESPGKALIVGGTREICADLYDADRRAAARLALRRARQGRHQGRLLRARRPTAAGRASTCAATPRTR